MKIKWNLFKRVINAYNIEERILSTVVLLIVLLASTSALVDLFKNPSLFQNENSAYVEASYSDRAAVINPLYADFSDTNRDLSTLVFSGLTKYDPSLKSFINDLAVLTITNNNKTYRFTLKDNLYWHDGEKVTADDVYFTFHDLIQDPDFQNPVLKANFDGVEIKKIDGKTVDFNISSPNSFFITNFNVGILPRHILKDVAVVDLPYHSFNLKPIGTGPYKVTGQLENLPDGKQRVTLTKNDMFYGPKPSVNSIKFYVYPTPEALLKESSVIDVIAKIPLAILDSLKDDARFKLVGYELPQYTAVFFNMNSTVLNKYKVRLALQKSIDKQELLKIISNKSEVDTPLLELNQSEWINKPNLDEAKGALFDSGYKFSDGDKVYRKDSKGNILELKILTRSLDKSSALYSENTKLLNFLIERWKQIGVKVTPVEADQSEFENLLFARSYDMILTGQSLGYNLDTYSYWHSSQSKSNGLNLSNYKSFPADALIEKIRNSFNNTGKEDDIKQLAKVIADDIPAIFLYRPTYYYAADSKISGTFLDNLAFISDRFSKIDLLCLNCNK